MSTLAALGNFGWLASNTASHLRFHAALRRPRESQLALLREHLRQNAATDYGRRHQFSSITSYGEFRQRVPIVRYDELAPWVERIRCGQPNVLTRDRVTHLVPTSGSTSARKLIPFTSGLQRQFNRAIAPWICDLYGKAPSLAFGSAYWSITPVAQPVSAGESMVPIGFDDDMSYLGGLRKRLLSAVTAVPSAVRRLQDIETFRYMTLLCLLRRRDLALISVWHPSFLTLLMDALPRHWSALLADVQSGGCNARLPAELARAFRARPMPRRAVELREADPQRPQTLWPRLETISCWGDAHAEMLLDEIRSRFPRSCVQAKGLLATEAFVTIPFAGQCPLAIRSHFFEFIDDRQRVRLADELEPGGEYGVIVTTAGGLARYCLGDRVRVAGFVHATPSLKFLGREEGVSDRFGEKLSEAFAAWAIRELLAGCRATGQFAMLAPDRSAEGLRYTLFIEGRVGPDASTRLDDLLRRNPHYDYCRSLGQLNAASVFQIEGDGFETYAACQVAAGRKLGDIKPAALSPSTGWPQRFKGCYLLPASAAANTQSPDQPRKSLSRS